MKTYLLLHEQTIDRPLAEVFPFFQDAANLRLLVPDFVHFRIDTPQPIEMRPGTIIDYRLRLSGLPMRWRTEIEVFEPPHRFVDVQLRGPYRLWRHEHLFRETASGGTTMTDRVEYALPLGPLGRLAHAVFVRSTLHRIFEYRRRRVEELFGPGAKSDAVRD